MRLLKSLVRNRYAMFSISIVLIFMVVGSTVVVAQRYNQAKRDKENSELLARDAYYDNLAKLSQQSESNSTSATEDNTSANSTPVATPNSQTPKSTSVDKSTQQICDESAKSKFYTDYKQALDSAYQQYSTRAKDLLDALNFLYKQPTSTSTVLAISQNKQYQQQNEDEYTTKSASLYKTYTSQLYSIHCGE